MLMRKLGMPTRALSATPYQFLPAGGHAAAGFTPGRKPGPRPQGGLQPEHPASAQSLLLSVSRASASGGRAAAGYARRAPEGRHQRAGGDTGQEPAEPAGAAPARFGRQGA